MQTNFQICLRFTLTMEGGYADNPNDPGGSTMDGITLAVYREWKNDPNLTSANLRNISYTDLETIYKQNYWNVVQGDDLNSGVDLSVFDMQVNSGSNSVKILQALVGVMVDGVIGPITLAAANAIDAVTLINNLAIQQANFYRSLPTFAYFGDGWINRTNARHAAALSLATSTHKQTFPRAHHIGTDTEYFSLIKSI